MESAQKRLKGIEPIIAVIILVAVTLVIAIAVVGWIMGWWGTMGATESLRIYPDSNITGNKLYLHIKNEGTAASAIYKVEVLGLGIATPKNCMPTTGCTVISTTNEIVINPGVEVTVELNISEAAVAGTNYNVKLYTRSGSVITAIVTAYA